MYRIIKSTAFNNRNLNSTKLQFRTLMKNEFNVSTNNLNTSLNKKGFSFRNFGYGLSPILKFIVGAQALIYFIGIPMDMNKYVRSFFYNKQNSLSNGKIHTLITCHFVKTGLLDLLLDSFIVAAIGSNIIMTSGEMVLKKLAGASILLSSLFLLLGKRDDSFFYKSEAIQRGFIMYLVMQNPQASFTLFPIPIQIKAFYIGILIVVMDILSNKQCNFGGIFAGIMMARGLI